MAIKHAYLFSLQQAGSQSEDEIPKSKEEDNGSRSSLRSYAAAEEGRHHLGLITTSLTSIADSAVTRRSRRSSRRNRYGHRRPPMKVDPESESLYRKYTERHGDGLSHDYLTRDDRSIRRRSRYGRSRRSSVAR